MRTLPSGTVTFLFTDIEGSTRLLQELGERYVDALAEHRRVLREAFERHGGVEVDTQGDAFFIAFAEAGEAVAAAADAQRASASGRVRARMGIHTGEPIMWAEGYTGVDVVRAARICAAAHGGQVLLSERTGALLDGRVELRDLGLHRLKDLSEPQRLYQLGAADFAPVKTLHATNLPVQPSGLVGRERELSEVAALVGEHRLVTLTGSGGSGKTRLSLHAAAELVEEFPDGVWWVPLQALRDPGGIVPAVAATLGVQGDVSIALERRRALVVVDNVEQLLPEAGPVLGGLLSSTENLRLLVTSREPLRVVAERRYRVEPLSERDAVTLFVERAREVDVHVGESEAVAAICARLDGLPLAIELAAARLTVLSPDELLARLDERLALLTVGRRDAPARQQTLRATIEWSYDLLEPDEQRLFARLAVFAGSFDLDAVEQVADGDLDMLQSLVDKHLVRRVDDPRFGLLDTLHEFGLERLAASGEEDELRRRHAYYFADRDAAFEAEWQHCSPERGRFLFDALARDLPDARLAADWFGAAGDHERRLRLLWDHNARWQLRFPTEGARRLEEGLRAYDGSDPLLCANVLQMLAQIHVEQGDADRCRELVEEALPLAHRCGNASVIAELHKMLGNAAVADGDIGAARAHWEEAAETMRRAGHDDVAVHRYAVGILAFEEGDEAEAVAVLSGALDWARRHDSPYWRANAANDLAFVDLARGRVESARAYTLEALETSREYQIPLTSAQALLQAAAIVLDEGRADVAAALAAASEAQLRSIGRAPIEEYLTRLRRRIDADVVAELGEEATAAAHRAGEDLSLDDALALGLDALGAVRTPTSAPAR